MQLAPNRQSSSLSRKPAHPVSLKPFLLLFVAVILSLAISANSASLRTPNNGQAVVPARKLGQLEDTPLVLEFKQAIFSLKCLANGYEASYEHDYAEALDVMLEATNKRAAIMEINSPAHLNTAAIMETMAFDVMVKAKEWTDRSAKIWFNAASALENVIDFLFTKCPVSALNFKETNAAYAALKKHQDCNPKDLIAEVLNHMSASDKESCAAVKVMETFRELSIKSANLWNTAAIKHTMLVSALKCAVKEVTSVPQEVNEEEP